MIAVATATAEPATTATNDDSEERASASGSENFELEDNDQDNDWPAVDVGNLIHDLDADIDMSSSSPAVAAAAALAATGRHKVNSGSASVASFNMTAGSGGSATQTVIESPAGAGAGSPSAAGANMTEKSIKMKFKRPKQGAKPADGKLEIVQQQSDRKHVANGEVMSDSTASSNGEVPMPVTGLTADVVISAAKNSLASGGSSSNSNNNNRLKMNSAGSVNPAVSTNGGHRVDDRPVAVAAANGVVSAPSISSSSSSFPPMSVMHVSANGQKQQQSQSLQQLLQTSANAATTKGAVNNYSGRDEAPPAKKQKVRKISTRFCLLRIMRPASIVPVSLRIPHVICARAWPSGGLSPSPQAASFSLAFCSVSFLFPPLCLIVLGRSSRLERTSNRVSWAGGKRERLKHGKYMFVAHKPEKIFD